MLKIKVLAGIYRAEHAKSMETLIGRHLPFIPMSVDSVKASASQGNKIPNWLKKLVSKSEDEETVVAPVMAAQIVDAVEFEASLSASTLVGLAKVCQVVVKTVGVIISPLVEGK